MKKIISVISGVLSLSLFFWLSNYYTKTSYDYHIAQFVSCLFYWSITLFITSLFAFTLESKKYKIWLGVSVIYILLTSFVAYRAGDGNSMILSFDGKLTTLIFAGIYFFTSLIYFIVQFLKSRK